jgi:hypothetical protein
MGLPLSVQCSREANASRADNSSDRRFDASVYGKFHQLYLIDIDALRRARSPEVVNVNISASRLGISDKDERICERRCDERAIYGARKE